MDWKDWVALFFVCLQGFFLCFFLLDAGMKLYAKRLTKDILPRYPELKRDLTHTVLYHQYEILLEQKERPIKVYVNQTPHFHEIVMLPPIYDRLVFIGNLSCKPWNFSIYRMAKRESREVKAALMVRFLEEGF